MAGGNHKASRELGVPEGWRQTRKTFRHGNLAEALIAAALVRLEADGTDALSLRELARDAGVNHRAVYRHFPDKLSLLARVAGEGWRLAARRIGQQLAGKPKGKQALIAGGVGLYLFAREHPNLFQFIAGPRVNADAAFPDLETQVAAAMDPFRQAFVDHGMSEKTARIRTAIFLSALQGVVTQILHGRLHVPRAKAKAFIADTCGRLFEGLR
jgi:AcrR family transcriptional regulator